MYTQPWHASVRAKLRYLLIKREEYISVARQARQVCYENVAAAVMYVVQQFMQAFMIKLVDTIYQMQSRSSFYGPVPS
jgi:hypothetical protein